MKTSVELLAQADGFIQEAKAIQATADTENRDLTAEELAKIDALVAQANAAKAQADTVRKLEAADTGMDAPLEAIVTVDDPSHGQSGLPRVAATAVDTELENRHGFRDVGEFAHAVLMGMTPGMANQGVDPRLLAHLGDSALPVPQIPGQQLAAASGMNQAVPSEGGFAVPPSFSTTIWDGLNEAPDNLMGLVDQHTVEGQSLTFPANAETSRATGSRYGGVRGYWLEEAAEITASQPKLRGTKLEPKELAVLIYVTDKALRNSAVALNSFLSRAATDEINFMVGDAFINGTGVGKPLGILNSNCLVTVSKETSQAADTFNQENVAKMFARLHARRRSTSVWLVNQDVDPQLDLMVTNVKNIAGTENVGGFSAGLYNAQNDTLKGRPIMRLEYCKTLGDLGDVVLADMKGYAAGVKGGIRSAMSMHLRFNFAESAFRFMFEIDGQPWLQSAITPFNGANTLSTFVTLAARA